MIIYKVLRKNYELRKGELMGALVERRKDLRGKSQLESGLRWARLVFGQTMRDRHALFVIPAELNRKDNTIIPVGEMVLTDEEFLWMMENKIMR